MMRTPVLMLFALLFSAATLAAESQGPQCHVETTALDGYVLAMNKEHFADVPVASPAVSGALMGAHPVTTRLVSYHSVDGREVLGYLAQPTDSRGPVPGVLVFHEWWGLNANIEAMTRQLASLGYAAFAVDLYNGQKADTPEAASALMRAALANNKAMAANLLDGYAVLKRMQGAPKIATLGWCFGGAVSLNASLELGSSVDATVIYYGQLQTDANKLKALKAPVLGLFGGADQGIPLDGVRAFAAALEANQTPVEIHVYEGAGHAFANPSGKNYQAKAAEDAWQRVVGFLAEHLK